MALRPDHVDVRLHLRDLRFQQGGRHAELERFSESDVAFRQAASLSGGKKVWLLKRLGFCPTVFPDEESIDRYWNNLNESLDRALAAKVSCDWQTLPVDGFSPSFNLPHLGRNCRNVREKIAQLFENAFPHDKPSFRDVRKNRSKTRL